MKTNNRISINIFSKLFFSILFSLSSFNAWAQFKIGDKFKGEASYYAKKFHGRTTANGEKFNMYAMTAAHKKLPFNTVLKVENLANGKWVKVRINDRGPFVDDRIIDLSYAAAKNIDMIDAGVANIQFTILSIDENASEMNTGNSSGSHTVGGHDHNEEAGSSFYNDGTYSIWGTKRNVKGYGIQIAAHKELGNALETAKAAQKKLNEVYIQVSKSNGASFYRVIYGAWTTDDKARDHIRIAKQKGYRGAFLCQHL